MKTNWLEFLHNKWGEIPQLYKKTFLILFIALNITFAFHTFHFMWGNHEWPFLIKRIRVDAELGMGRYASHLLKQIFTGGHVMPVLSNAFAFAGLAFTAMVLFIYWKLPQKLYLYVLAGLGLVLQPYMVEWMFYTAALPDFFWAPLYVVLALILSEKAVSARRPYIYIYIIGAVILFLLALGVYPSLINAIAVVFGCRLIVDFLSWDGSLKQLADKLIYHRYAFINVIVSCFLFKAIWLYLERTGRWVSFYVNKNISLSDIPERLLSIIKAAFMHLWDYSFPFFSPYFTGIIFVIIILAVISIVLNIFSLNIHFKAKLAKVALILILLFATIVGTQSAGLLADSFFSAGAPRIDFYGVAYFNIFAVAYILAHKTIPVRNIGFVLVVCVIWINVIKDINAQKVWYLGFESEKMLWNRITSRIESIPEFDPQREYTLVMVGTVPASRPAYYSKKYKNMSPPLLNFAYDTSWSSFSAIEFFYPGRFIGERCYVGRDSQSEFCTEIMSSSADEISASEAWPHPSSIQIKDDILLVIMEKEKKL